MTHAKHCTGMGNHPNVSMIVVAWKRPTTLPRHDLPPSERSTRARSSATQSAMVATMLRSLESGRRLRGGNTQIDSAHRPRATTGHNSAPTSRWSRHCPRSRPHVTEAPSSGSQPVARARHGSLRVPPTSCLPAWRWQSPVEKWIATGEARTGA